MTPFTTLVLILEDPIANDVTIASPVRASKWKFSNMATWGFFVEAGDELEYRSNTTTTPNQVPILVNGTAALEVDRVRVKRDPANGAAITQRPEKWLWEWFDPDQQEWLELGFFSGPKDLEVKLLDFFARDFGGQFVTGPAMSLEQGVGSWDRFSWTRPGQAPKTLNQTRSEYWQQQQQRQQQ